ncbi:TonB-dependent siderophore receptor [Pseudomonas sp. 5P_5.1_Bac1]|uniref:TonB-dependent siderophore receptor n=1 Tax=Pseudomonas sp. 5P_5.1_Bac1 TaxID=2971616 RepID=UPI0021C8C505|nr:TonB-dependent siderophore receptor [Pseudomonas sp. 5P_5.1_Bac1]MCU1725014.1 TonB-dependent siderophore receptor [Pseudomonas sp. 5P_5.1_Bac1]
MHTPPRLTPLSKALLLSRALRAKPSLAAIGMALTLPIAAQVQAQEVEFNIPAQPLAGALSELGRQANLQVLFSTEDVRGKTGSAVHGRLTPQQAAGKLLGGSGLSYSVQGDTLTLAASDSSASVNLAPTSINSHALGTTTENTGSYTTGAVTIGKGAHSLRETPQSVSIITRKLMDDKNLNTLDQVLAKTPGLSFTQRNFGSHQYQSRGFVLGEEAFMMDGIPGQTYNLTGWMPLDMAFYDRVEVLRGASGLLVGAGSPGGAINLVRKRPTSEPQFSITTRAGSWDNYRMDLDGSGRLNDEGTLRGRVVAAYEDRGTYLDGQETQTPLFYGIVEGDLSEDTTVALSVRRQKSNMNGYSIYDLPRYNNGNSLDISRSTTLSQNWAYKDSETDEAFAELTHRFNDNWTSKTTLIHTEGDFASVVPYAQALGSPIGINPITNAGATWRGVEFRDVSMKGNGVDSFVEGNFDAFGLTHEVTVGASWSKQTVGTKRGVVTAGIVNTPVNVFDVNHNALIKPARPAWSQINESTEERKGIFANTRIHLSEPLSLILGTRLSWYNYDYNDKIGTGDYENKQTREFTPFAGLIYDINENWSWYASYADIFKPQANYRSVSGSPLDPAVGTNYETGIKGELFDKQLNVSMALFYIKQEDVLGEDVANRGRCPSNDAAGTCYFNVTTQRSKGVDLEASGEVLPGLQVMGGYTYNMTSSSSASPLTTDTPKHIARVSTMYTLPAEWNRVSAGVGVSAQSGFSNKTNGVEFGDGGRAIWDARVAYKLDEHWSVAVNGENLFDRRYYISAPALDRGNIFGAPRSYMLTLRGDF